MKMKSSLWRLAVLAGSLACVYLALGCGESVTEASVEPMAGAAEPLQPKLRVRAEPVRRVRLDGAGRVTGTVRAFHRAEVMAEIQGRVVSRAAETGARVAAGEAVVMLEASRVDLELRRAEASLQAAETVLAHARRELARGEKLVSKNAISTQRLDDLRHNRDRARDELALAKVARDTARRNLEDTRIAAPFAGTVDSLAVDVGDFVAPGSLVATVVDLSRVRIFAGVTGREAARLQLGGKASVTFTEFGGTAFEATLHSVGRVADPTDGTYEIELWMDDPEARMRDGLVARVELPDANEEMRLVALRGALLRRAGRPEVFVVEREAGRDVARLRTLRTGRTEGDWVEILAGLEEGDLVIYDGNFALDDGSLVNLERDGNPLVPAATTSARQE